MHFILDHIVAVTLGGVVLILLAALSLRSQEEQVDAVRYYAGRLNVNHLTEMIERDVRNLGSGVPAGQAEIVAYDWNAPTRHFEFYTQVDTVAGKPARRVRYELQKTYKIASEKPGVQDSVQCYVFVRFENDGSVFREVGRSIDTLTELAIVLEDADRNPVGGAFDNTQFVHIKLEAVSPFGEDQAIRRFRWQSRYRPLNLSF